MVEEEGELIIVCLTEGEREKKEVELLIVCVMLVLISHTDRKVGRDTMT